MPTEKTWQQWLERLYNLRREKRGSHERPHKPVLLLSILDIFDRGIICHNQVPFSAELIKTFERYFEVVQTEDDQPTIENPFYHLGEDGFWNVLPKSGSRPIYDPDNVSRPPSMRILRDTFGRFDESLWSSILTFANSRRQLRAALIARYFPEHREALDALTGRPTNPAAALAEAPPGREGAFRSIILDIYDYRCAACGISVKLTDDLSLVGAAHLIPFHVSRSDRPDNGLALCPNHHWAMDHHLIAPCPDDSHPAGIWKVRDELDPRIEGQKDLVELADKPVIPPSEEKFYPSAASLRWREQHLADKYQG